MTDQSVREEALKRKYPVGTKGRLRPIDVQTLTHIISRGWEPSFVVTVESAYIAGCDSVDCLVVRWGQGQADWSGVMAEGFQAIATVSESTKIETWFDEGYNAASKEGGDGQCPYDDDYHWFDEYLWWNRGYRYADRSARLLEAEQLIEKLKGDRT